MIYVGIDLSSKSFMVRAKNESRKVVFSGEISPTRSGLDKLMRELPNERRLVTFEAGNQLKWVADHLKKDRLTQLHVVHPNEVKWIVSSNGKTDSVDADKLCNLARTDMLPRAVHIVEGHVRELRELVSARHLLQSKRIGLINATRGFVKQEGHKLPEKFFQSVDWKRKLSSLKVTAPLKLVIDSYMTAIDSLVVAEEKITDRILEIQDPRIELLKTIPAFGELSSRVILSALDNVDRFDNQKCVANYGALTPTIYQSGNTTHLGRINRDGRHEIRRCLLQCAHTITRMKSPAAKPLKDFYERIAKKRGKKTAVVALARKLLTTAYGVLKGGQVYDPKKLVA
jgi:transposase